MNPIPNYIFLRLTGHAQPPDLEGVFRLGEGCTAFYVQAASLSLSLGVGTVYCNEYVCRKLFLELASFGVTKLHAMLSQSKAGWSVTEQTIATTCAAEELGVKQ